MPDYIPTKVLLHDPDSVTNPKSLYPVTGLNAIVAGTSGDKINTYIVTTNNQIKYQYLEIMGSTSKVGYDYLPITFDSNNGKIANVSLDIFDATGHIQSNLLPSFVDDVIEIPVIETTFPAEGDLCIKEIPSDSGTTYRFYTRVSGNNWELGGGETGKIYIASASSETSGDGSIYRCVTGDPTTAIKISENPYVFDQTATNGVALNINNGVITAQAVSATINRLGTVQIDNTAVNNVRLQITDGVLSVSAGMAAGTSLPGLVFAAGSEEDAAVLTEAYGNTFVVPTTKYMKDYVDSVVVGIDYATKDHAGIVQIGNNINVGNNGYISVSDASANTAGVVQIVDTIANTPSGNTGNTGKAVTLGGITTYVGAALAAYQKTVSAGNGIDITRGTGFDTIAAKYVAPIALNGDALTVSKATTGNPGVVVYTGDSSYITNETVTDSNNNPIVVNAKAVKDYVATVIQSAHVEVKTPLYYDANDGLLTASAATTSKTGIVKLTSAIAYDGTGSSYDSYVVPSANAVQNAIYSGLSGKQDSVEFVSGVVNSSGTVTAVIDSSTYPWMHLDSKGIGVTKATNQLAGVVKLVETSAGIIDSTNSSSVPTASALQEYVSSEIEDIGVEGSAGFVPTSTTIYSSGVEVKLGGIRVVEAAGIGLESGNIYLEPATSSNLGGIQIGTSGAGLVMGTDGKTLKIKKSLPLDIVDNTLIVSNATSANPGVVVYTGDSRYITSETVVDANNNPVVVNAKAVKDYVNAAIQSAHVDVKNPLYYDPEDGDLTVYNASSNQAGVVEITSGIAYDGTGSAYASYVVPNANAVQSALSAGLATKQNSLSFSSGVTSASNVVKAVVDSSTYPWMHLDSNGIGVTKATNQQAGVVKIVETSAGLVDSTNSASVPTASAVQEYVTAEINELGVDGSAGYVPASNTVSSGGVEVKLGGIRVVENTGIGLESGNIYLAPATSSTLGGIQLAQDGTALVMDNDGKKLKIQKALPLDIVSNTLIVSKAVNATTSGVVTVLSTGAAVSAATDAYAVPNAAGLIDYVSSNNMALAGNGILWSGGSLNVQVTEPIQITSDAVGIRQAAAETGTTLTSAANGAVYVRGVVRTADSISSDNQGITLNTVPTESAVRALVDNTSTTIISSIDSRLYITYTPLNN